MQKANKTYKCNDLEVGSTLSQQLAEGYTISLQDFCLPEKLLETARRRCRHRTRNQSSATWCKYWIDYLRELYGLLGWGAPPSADVPPSTTALPLPMASLAGDSAIWCASLSCVAYS